MQNTPSYRRGVWGLMSVLVLGLAGCSSGGGTTTSDVADIQTREAEADLYVKTDWGTWTEGDCVVPEGETPDFVNEVGCSADFYAVASAPLDASIPGSQSTKTVIDQAGNMALYFQNSEKYQIHYEFCKEHLSGNGLPPIGDMASFSQTEYYSPYRRFLLGAITFYEEPGVWVYEIAPYDTAQADMVTTAYDIIREQVFFGEVLYFHPTSNNVEVLLPDLPEHVKIITTDELFAGVTFLPLNLGETIGQLRFVNTVNLETGKDFVTPLDVVVLDSVPNDIAVVAAIITEELQTPLSHINVLSQNRGTPNMSLVGAMTNPELRALEGKWVRLTVDPFNYFVEEVSQSEAEAWWEEHKPPPVKVPPLDLSATDLRNTEDLVLDDIPAYGGKASHYGILCKIGDPVPVPKAFAIPVYYYKQFEQMNGFDERIAEMIEEEKFNSDILYREQVLEQLRNDMMAADWDPDFEKLLVDKINADYPGIRMRFRSSTNAEDLDGFTGAGLYTSQSGDPSDPTLPIMDAVKTVWASLWNFRAFEERSFRSIDHMGVAMAMLVHRSFPDEDSNGVALTNNIFDETQPGFYINVQLGDIQVVKPPPGIIADQFLYYYYYPGQPTTFFAHSNLIPEGETVMTKAQTYKLGQALEAIHQTFADYYFKIGSFYAMDVEFKYNQDPGDPEPLLWLKQARPHPGWGTNSQENGGTE